MNLPLRITFYALLVVGVIFFVELIRRVIVEGRMKRRRWSGRDSIPVSAIFDTFYRDSGMSRGGD